MFSQYSSTLEWLKQRLPEEGFGYRTITGSMPLKQRSKAIEVCVGVWCVCVWRGVFLGGCRLCEGREPGCFHGEGRGCVTQACGSNDGCVLPGSCHTVSPPPHTKSASKKPAVLLHC